MTVNECNKSDGVSIPKDARWFASVDHLWDDTVPQPIPAAVQRVMHWIIFTNAETIPNFVMC
jgi:hypothetical protein